MFQCLNPRHCIHPRYAQFSVLISFYASDLQRAQLCKQNLLSKQRIFTDTKTLFEGISEAVFVHWNSVGWGSLTMQMCDWMKRTQMWTFSFLYHGWISCWFAMLSEMANSRFFFSRLIISKIPLLWMVLFCEWRPVDSTYSNKPKALRW